MARGSKKEVTAAVAADPEAEERARLKGLAFSTNVLSQKPARIGPSAALATSKTVIKHHGKDILRKSQRKNRYLFSFPGLLGPISGGKIGELKDLGTKNPILYLDFPQGQMKLFGTIVYPKNRYLTLQFSKGGKSVTCDDYFDNMIVFSDAWWIGRKEDNPEELRLEFPKELNVSQEKHEELDFKGGVGVACDGKQGLGRLTKDRMEQVSPQVSPENSSDSPSGYKELVEVTPTRHSARTAGKAFNFADVSSGDDITIDGEETPEEEELKTESSGPELAEAENDDKAGQDLASRQHNRAGKAKDPSDNTHTPLVQTTLSSLFKKVEDKKVKKNVKQKRNTSEVSKLKKGEKKTRDKESASQKKSKSKGSSTASKKKGDSSPDPNDSTQVEDDDIEEFSSASQDIDASDEDWTA